jgi:hypothetical protein
VQLLAEHEERLDLLALHGNSPSVFNHGEQSLNPSEHRV